MRLHRRILCIAVLCIFPLSLQAENKTLLSHEQQRELFKVYCAIGDSVTQGCQSLNVEERRQYWSFPAQLARQMGTEFNQPLMRYPGCGFPNIEDVIKDKQNIGVFSYIRGLVFPKRVNPEQDNINNFGISGATLSHILDWDLAVCKSPEHPIVRTTAFFSPWITATLGGQIKKRRESAVDQALKRNPTFLTIWIGNNDVFFSAVSCTDSLITPLDFWCRMFDELVERIKATPSVKGVALINIPDVTAIPFLQPINNPHHKTTGPVTPGSMIPFFIRESASDREVLTPAEIEKIRSVTAKFNEKIASTAKEQGWALIDMSTQFNDAMKNGRHLQYADGRISDIVVRSDYATGGLFSLDGIHPSSTGYACLANVIIKGINEFYGTTIPLVDEVAVWKQDSICQQPVDPRQVQDWRIMAMGYTFYAKHLKSNSETPVPTKVQETVTSGSED